MKKIVLVLLYIPVVVLAQVGVGTNTPNPSAMLEISTTDKGFLPPRIALTGTTDVLTIPSPVAGLMIYNTSTTGSSSNSVTPGFYYYDGSKWQRIINQQPDATIVFNSANPNLNGTTFIPNIPSSTDYIYVSSSDNSQWTWDGITYLTYSPPASTAWYLSGSNNDAGSNKAGAITRSGKVGIGNNNPNANLDIRNFPTNTSDPGSGYFGLGTTTESASTAGAGALRYTTSSGGALEYSNGSSWNLLTSSAQRANVYATRLSSSDFSVNNSTADNTFGDFSASSGSGTANFNSTTGVFTAPRTGLYTLSAGMSFELLVSSSGTLHFLVIKNGTIEVCNQAVPANYSTSTYLSANISCSVPLNVGDTLQVKYHNFTGSIVNVKLHPTYQGRYYFTVSEN